MGTGNFIEPVLSSVAPPPGLASSTKFIAGLPMKPATKRLIGVSYSCWGVPTCWSRPSLMTAIRWPIVIASTWSWVT